MQALRVEAICSAVKEQGRKESKLTISADDRARELTFKELVFLAVLFDSSGSLWLPPMTEAQRKMPSNSQGRKLPILKIVCLSCHFPHFIFGCFPNLAVETRHVCKPCTVKRSLSKGLKKKFHKFHQCPGHPEDHRKASQPVLKSLIVPFLRYLRKCRFHTCKATESPH